MLRKIATYHTTTPNFFLFFEQMEKRQTSQDDFPQGRDLRAAPMNFFRPQQLLPPLVSGFRFKVSSSSLVGQAQLFPFFKRRASSILFQGLLACVGEFFIKYRFLPLLLLLGRTSLWLLLRHCSGPLGSAIPLR